MGAKILVTIGLVGLFIVAVGAVAAISGWIIMVLWNALVPALFAGPVITFWQGVLISIALSVIGSFFRSSTKSK